VAEAEIETSRLSKKPSAGVCRPQAAKKFNRFSCGVYVGKTLCAERSLFKKDASHLF
jgi:hypothetical protein